MNKYRRILLAVFLVGVIALPGYSAYAQKSATDQKDAAKKVLEGGNVVGFYAGDEDAGKKKTGKSLWQKIYETKHETRRDTSGKNAAKRPGTFLSKLILTCIIIFVGYFLMFFIVRLVNRHVADLKMRHLIRKRVIYVINMTVFIFIVLVWLEHMSSAAVFLSILGAGIALALQEVLLCIAGWFLIITRSPFQVGDRVEIGGVKGDVIDIRLFQTSLLEIGNWVDSDQSTGRIVNIPNSAIFKKENFNYNQGFEFIWNEIKVIVTFESDWKRAEEIMKEHAEKVASGKEDLVKKKIDFMTRRYMIKYGKLTPIVYVKIVDSGIELILRYLTEARKRRSSQDEIARAILESFDLEEKVNFAYTTYRIVKD